ncbi:MAG: rhamnulokinase [Bacteroidales bacterium]|nr:rhamnulokinase [Bacteroidales bacterium]
MQTYHFLAFDLGASSGRAILGSLANKKITLKEIHRFENQMILREGHYYWDIRSLFSEIKLGLKKCINHEGITPHCLGIDTWGVDFGLLDYTGQLSGDPFAYRDSLTDKAIDEVLEEIPGESLYQKTGIQFMQFNSLFQLWSLKKQYPDRLLSADKVLFMPDLLSFFLTGVSYSEYTIASTSQMLNPEKARWDMALLHQLGIPTHLLEDIVEPGTVIGNLKPELQAELGIGPIPVAAVAAHDTASAIAAIPAKGKDWAYLSSGTWSLLGIELDKPCLSEEAYEAAFTNEGGVDSTIRFLKNITGLWLLSECKKIWDQNKKYSFADLAILSESAPAFVSMVDPDCPEFSNPDNMVSSIQNYCLKTNQPVPESIAEISRCIFESLALKYKSTLDKLIKVTGRSVKRIHLIGGGSKNQVLCQYTANATRMEVIAGPAEGTALGNILMQARSLGIIDSLDEMRDIVASNVETQIYNPQNQKAWDTAFSRFETITSSY